MANFIETFGKFLEVDRNFYLMSGFFLAFTLFYLCAGIEHTIKARQAFEYNKCFHLPIRITNSWRGNSVEVQYPPFCKCQREKERGEESTRKEKILNEKA